MKKIAFIMLFLALLFYGTSAMADLQAGSWQGSLNGTPNFYTTLWQETYVYFNGSNAPGQPGNYIYASGFDAAGQVQWQLGNSYLQTVTDLGSGKYETTYTGGNLYLYATGPWWTGDPTTSPVLVGYMSYLNESQNSGNSTTFTITGTGETNDNKWFVTVIAQYSGTPGSLSGAIGVTDSLNSGTITIRAVPLPAALWLFGPGLIGIAAIRRRLRK